MNTFSIKTDESGEVTIFDGSKLAAQMIDLTDLGMCIVPHKLNTLSEMQALEIIFNLGYKTIAEKMMAEIVAEEAYINNEAAKDQKMMDEQEEESCPLCDTYHNDWDNCFHMREEY